MIQKNLEKVSGLGVNVIGTPECNGKLQVNQNPLKFMTELMGLNRSEMLRELIDEGRKMKSIELYKQGKVSLGLGAKIAKLSISEYIDLLKEYNIQINIDIDDAKKALEYARTNL